MKGATAELLRLLDVGIKPHAETIMELAAEGAVAIVVFEPGETTKDAARALGWDGRTPVFRMTAGARRRLARSDTITERWLEGKRHGVARLFVLMHDGTLLVNYTEGRGFSIEPGSLDSERA